MAQMNISNTLFNDTSTGVIAYVEQLKDRLLRTYIANNPNYTTTDKGRIPVALKSEVGVFQEKLNEFFLDHWVAFQRFLLDEGLDPDTIDSWKEVQEFLKGLPDDEAKWLQNKLTSIDTAIAGVDQNGIGTFDVSAYNNDDGVYAQYANLSTALAGVPIASRKSGMAIRFINSETQQYEMWEYQKEYVNTTDGNNAFTTESNWYGFQDTDAEPVAGSVKPVQSGGVQNELALGAIYDVSAKNPTAGLNSDGKWESLSALLSDTNFNTLIPLIVRKGGMSIKFVRSSDNKYVQFRYMSSSTAVANFNNVANWQDANDGAVARELGERYSISGKGDTIRYIHLDIQEGDYIVDVIIEPFEYSGSNTKHIGMITGGNTVPYYNKSIGFVYRFSKSITTDFVEGKNKIQIGVRADFGENVLIYAVRYKITDIAYNGIVNNIIGVRGLLDENGIYTGHDSRQTILNAFTVGTKIVLNDSYSFTSKMNFDADGDFLNREIISGQTATVDNIYQKLSVNSIDDLSDIISRIELPVTPTATQESNGLMSSVDKQSLDKLVGYNNNISFIQGLWDSEGIYYANPTRVSTMILPAATTVVLNSGYSFVSEQFFESDGSTFNHRDLISGTSYTTTADNVRLCVKKTDGSNVSPDDNIANPIIVSTGLISEIQDDISEIQDDITNIENNVGSIQEQIFEEYTDVEPYMAGVYDSNGTLTSLTTRISSNFLKSGVKVALVDSTYTFVSIQYFNKDTKAFISRELLDSSILEYTISSTDYLARIGIKHTDNSDISVNESPLSVIQPALIDRVSNLEDRVSNLENEIVILGSPQIYISQSTDNEQRIDNITTDGRTRLENLYKLYDDLVESYPSLFSKKTSIGKDESNTYDINHYCICDNINSGFLKKRLLFTTGVHGWAEPIATRALYDCVFDILSSTEQWALFLKANFIIDIIPMINPWGLMNSKSVNVNDINLNRDYSNENKQQETINMIGLITELLSKNLVGIVDLHTFDNSGNGVTFTSNANYTDWNYYQRLTSIIRSALQQTLDGVYETDSNHVTIYNSGSTIGQLHWYANEIGVLGCTIENSNTLSMKQVKPEKDVAMNVIISFLTK